MANNIKKIIVVFIVSVFVFVLGSIITTKLNYKTIATVNLNNEYNIIAGVIRNNGDGWKLIQDQNHETIGIKSVEQDNEKIIIKYDKNSKVNSLSCTVDETMGSEGYTVGASVGVDQTFIYVYDKDHKAINPKDYVNNYGNIWIEGIFKK